MSIDNQTGHDAAPPVHQASADRTPRRPAEPPAPFGRPLFTTVWVAVWTVALTALVWVRQPQLFTERIYPLGDAALNSLLVLNAEHLEQVAGNYSRVGFHHPGPGFLYLLAVGDVLFDRLHLSPTPYNGQLAITTVYATAFFTLAGTILGALGRSRWAAAVAIVTAFAFGAASAWYGVTWFPMLYAPAFLLFMAAAAAVGSGRTWGLPPYILAAGLLGHGHVSFLLFVAASTLAVAVGWWHAHRGALRATLGRHRLAVWVAAGLTVLYAAPLVWQTVRRFPQPWSGYYDFSRGAQNDPRTLSQVVSYVATYWSETPWWGAVYVVAFVVVITLIVRDRDLRRKSAYAWVLGLLALNTLLAVFYAYRGVDHLEPRAVAGYVLLWYQTLPLMLVMAAASYLVSVLVRAPRPVAVVSKTVAVVAAAGLLLGVWATTRVGTLPPDGAGYYTVATTLRDAPEREGQTIGLTHVTTDSWADVAGFAMELSRLGVPWCIAAPNATWANLYTEAHMCGAGQPTWVVDVSTTAPPAGAQVLFAGPLAPDTGWVTSVFRPSA